MTAAPAPDYLAIERALSGTLSIDQLNQEEKTLCRKYKSLFEVGRLAHRMAQGYYAHTAAIAIANGQRAKALASATALGQISGYVTRKDGTQHAFDVPYYLNLAHTNPKIVEELTRIWLVGSLLSVGDALNRLRICYLRQVPLLELLYHLRNGIAHGNVFNFDNSGVKRLQANPAHNKAAAVKSQTRAEFEIIPSLSGKPALQGKPVLFDFMGPGDVLDLLQSVESYFTRIRDRHIAGELDRLVQ
jgi:hypothetical protein